MLSKLTLMEISLCAEISEHITCENVHFVREISGLHILNLKFLQVTQ